MFSFTPLLGAQSDSSACQSLLEFDGGTKVLIDIGWDERFDTNSLQPLIDQVSSISLILLTHATLDHLGAFAHFCKHVPQFKSIPIYATSPVILLGRSLLQDLYASSPRAATTIPALSLAEAALTSGNATIQPLILLQPPTADELSSYFSLITPLRYSQPLNQPIGSPSSPPLQGLTITAYGAGHTLGGTMWHIQHGLESIIYAVDWNQAKESTLSGAAWLANGAEIQEPLRRPTALICSSKGIERPHIAGGRRKRDERLLEAIEKTVMQGGMVLIPTDSSARILELAHLVEQFWKRMVTNDNSETFKTAKAYLASRTASSTINATRSMLEWMDEDLIRELEVANDARRGTGGINEDKQDQSPFDFKHIKLIERKGQLSRALNANKAGVIIASDASMDWGFSTEAFRHLCSDPKNLVILTECQNADDLDHSPNVVETLYKIWREKVGNAETDALQVIHDEMELLSRRIETSKLDDQEMTAYQQYLARNRQIQSLQQSDTVGTEANTMDVILDEQDSDSSESSDESDNDDKQGKALNLFATMNQAKRKIGLTDAELGINILLRKKTIYDYDVRGKKGREKIFPFVVKRGRDDIYGAIIRPEDYLRAEEKDEDVQDEINKIVDASTVGQKRKWADINKKDIHQAQHKTNNGRSQRKMKDHNGDTAMAENEDREVSDDEESDYEPDETPIDGPQKLIISDVPLTVRIGICYTDLSGLYERRDLQLIALIKPRKMIITCGSVSETNVLAADCRAYLGEGKDAEAQLVFSPRVGDTVDASVDTSAWTVKLTRDLVKKLKWQHVRGLGIVALTAKLGSQVVPQPNREQTQEQQRSRKKLKTLENGEAHDEATEIDVDITREPILDLLPTNMTSALAVDSDHMTMTHITQPIHVGDLRLADLRRLMQGSGHVAEFRGEGTLLVDGTVIVRKTAGGQINVEGGSYMGGGDVSKYDPNESFIDVRRKIYEGLAVVAGA